MIYILLTAIIIDLIIGDPRFYPHPVVLIGRLISSLEALSRKVVDNSFTERIAGIFVVLLTLSVTYILTAGIIWLADYINFYLGIMINVFLLSTTIAIKGLAGAGCEVYQLLKQGDISAARRSLNWIVGRDTQEMKITDIIRATVETVAENTSDGILAPVFFFVLGGTPLAMTYKAVNTLDSMLGYKNETYRYLGWAAARLDDLANFIPARLTGTGFVLAALLMGKNWKQSLKVMLRDARKHSSLNAGFPESSVAGALEVRLGGLNYYQGQASFSNYLGDEKRKLVSEDINSTVRLMYVNIALFLLGFSLILLVF
ncbi:MAG: adenosylcobinamide-phosphate synthase CbiB [Bacillota bacterium]